MNANRPGWRFYIDYRDVLSGRGARLSKNRHITALASSAVDACWHVHQYLTSLYLKFLQAGRRSAAGAPLFDTMPDIVSRLPCLRDTGRQQRKRDQAKWHDVAARPHGRQNCRWREKKGSTLVSKRETTPLP